MAPCPGQRGRGTGSVGLVVCAPPLGMYCTDCTCPADPVDPRAGVLAAADHCTGRCTFHPHGAWLVGRNLRLQDACSSVAAVDTFLAVDLCMGHQGELLGQNTGWHRNHVAAVVEVDWVSTSLCRLQKASSWPVDLQVPCCRQGPCRVPVFVHIHKDTVVSGSFACYQSALVGHDYTAHPFHCWALAA